MNNNKNRSGMHGPGMGNNPGEKPHNLKQATSKLISYLKPYLTSIIIALILACLGSIFSIVGPNKISDLTNMISDGLVINQSNLENLTTAIQDEFKNVDYQTLTKEVILSSLTKENITSILTSSSLNKEDESIITKFLSTQDITLLLNLSSSTQELLLPSTTINNITISTADKISYLNVLNTMSKDPSTKPFFPSSILELILSDKTIANITISKEDQASFIASFGTDANYSDIKTLYQTLDTMPSSITELIKPSMDLTGIRNLAIFLLVLYLCSAIFNFFQSYIMATVSNRFAQNLRTKISHKINLLPLKYFDSHETGDILSRVTNDVDTIGTSMSQSLGNLVGAITLFLGSIIMMFTTNWLMALTAILSSLIGFILMFIILGKSQKYFTARQVELGKLNGHIEEIYTAHNVVKAYNGEKEALTTFRQLNNNVYECNLKSQFLSGLMQPIMGFIGNFSYVAVCVVGALLVMNNQITFGVIVAFMIYIRLFSNPLSQIALGMTQLQTTAAASERVFEFIEEPEMSSEKNLTTYLEPSKVTGNIIFDHVKFGYNPDKLIIKDFSSTIKPGSKIAIVGPTGAGKTTIVNLLMKFYETNSGNIIIDNHKISDLTRSNIHDLFIMVLQDTWLFNGTIRDNIKYNQENITDEEIWNALEVVGVDHFVRTLPNTLDYQLGDNDSISAGQKQLLTIARGMIKNAPFLILDEATSSVDTRTEELVQKAMDKLTIGRTSFIIAHRLSTIKNADYILVMKDGNIIEQGNHETLLKQKGFYADLYNSQFEN